MQAEADAFEETAADSPMQVAADTFVEEMAGSSAHFANAGLGTSETPPNTRAAVSSATRILLPARRIPLTPAQPQDDPYSILEPLLSMGLLYVEIRARQLRARKFYFDLDCGAMDYVSESYLAFAAS